MAAMRKSGGGFTADDVGADRPDYLSLRAPGIGIPFYREMRMHWPRFGAFLDRARADRLDVIHYTTPGPVGLAARYVAAKLGLPMIGRERRSETQRAVWRARPQVPIVAYVGRLSREKGLDALPGISRSIRAHGQPHRLLFVGDGPMRAELQAACPDAIFTGRVPHHQVPELLASADLFWFPSRTDTFGNVVLEAQACGLPVIVTDEGGPREAVVHGETGLVCGARGPFTLSLALSWLLRQPVRRAQMGAAARRHAVSRSWPRALEPLFAAWRDAHRAGGAVPLPQVAAIHDVRLGRSA
jgi:glycosyltransferase involved in cell wall biosynthesis